MKSVFLFCALLLSIATGASAADAVVAADPEPAEYVRVCDVYGTGYFYIPGTETCLKIEGYIRVEERFGRDLVKGSDWNSWMRAQTSFSSKSETEYGTLTGVIT